MAEARLVAPALNFSTNGQHLALSCADGTLKVWDTATGSLNQEYVPSSHLSATCTCLAWCPKSHVLDTRSPGSKRKKKRKSDVGTGNLELIAMGTMSGNVLLYSVTKGDMQSHLTEGHTGSVNGVCWSRNGQNLFSCSDDGAIAEWHMSKATPKQKWKADDNPIHAVAVFGNDQLLTASREIKLWNLDKREVAKIFTGHSSLVQWLMPVVTEDSRPSYFLSATLEDRHVSVWETSSASSKTALALLSLEEEPIYLDTWSPSTSGTPFVLLVVTKCGKLQVFEHTLNGRLKKPIKPKYSVQVASETNSSSNNRPSQIPILSACIINDNEKQVLFSFGTSLKPVFEKLDFSDLQKDTIIVREDPRSSKINHVDSLSKLKVTEVSSDITVLAPGRMAPSAPAMAKEETKEKTKRKRTKSVDLTMEERLNALGIDKPDTKSKQGLPRTDTLCTLLTQGLQSQDKKILNHVLQTTDKKLVTNTVKKLPMPVIIPLVKELTKRMQGHAQSGRQLIVWVRCVLTTHTSYLMSFPELIESLSSLYQMMEGRVRTYGQLSRLQGKLGLMMSQIGSQGQDEEEEAVTVQQPLLAYQDESSDEQEMEFDAESSESDGDWDGASDIMDEATQNGQEEEEEDMEEDDVDDDDEDDDDDDEDD